MSSNTYGTRRFRPGFDSLSALDFGLRVRIEARPRQGTIFSGAENLSAQELTSELAELVSRLRVRSFGLRWHLERVTSVTRQWESRRQLPTGQGGGCVFDPREFR